jgi:hypothetical protein
MYTGFCGRNLKEGDCFDNLGINWRIILEQILRKWYGMVCTGFIWLRTGASGRLLETWSLLTIRSFCFMVVVITIIFNSTYSLKYTS